MNEYENVLPQKAEEHLSAHQKYKMKQVVAIFLCGVLLGGFSGGIIAWVLGQSEHSALINHPTDVIAEDSPIELTDAALYKTNVKSTVSIDCAKQFDTLGNPEWNGAHGSGFVLTSDGYLVTNSHVIKDAHRIRVTLYDGEELMAVRIGANDEYDVAVLKIEKDGLQPVVLGDSSLIQVGDSVRIIGSPLGHLAFSMSSGIISCGARSITVADVEMNMLQTDAPINPGNSGGPLFNRFGELVGIVAAKYATYSNEALEGLGFAIPINDVVAVLTDLVADGAARRPACLGITPETMTAQRAQSLGLTEGIYITKVDPGGPAAQAGLQQGDVITAVEGSRLKTVENLAEALALYAAEDTIVVSIFRERSLQTINVCLGAAA